MDTLDNANATNPFVNSNPDIHTTKENFVFNLTEGCKLNGSENVGDFLERSANGKRSVEEFDEDDDFGPETDVDTIDEIPISPTPLATKNMMDELVNNNPIDIFYDNKEEKATLEADSQKHEISSVEALREETPTPSANSVQDTSGLVDNVAESGDDSEDEWNYFKGDQAEKENINSLQSDKKVFDLDLDLVSDTMSQLNPNAAEFVPISPKRETNSPVYHTLIDDLVISQSPRRITNNGIDINVPNPQEFETEIKLRPSDVRENANEDETDKAHNLSSQELMENLLNGKTIEEIEFQPNSTPVNVQKAGEFHFGPNSTPFSTPGKFMDQSTVLSTKAVFGDESTYLNDSFNDEVQVLEKEEDCMSMSFYEDKEEQNLDLNKVQLLPENVDEFLDKSKEELPVPDGTVSDIPVNGPACKLPMEELISIVPTVEPVCKLPMEDPVCNLLTKDQVFDLPTQDQVCALPKKEEVCALPTNDQVYDLLIKDEVCDFLTKDQVSYLPTQDQVSDLPIKDEVCDFSTKDQVFDLPTQDQVCALPKEKVCDLPTNDQICDLPIQGEVCDFSTKDQVCDLPMKDSDCDLPIEDLDCKLSAEVPVFGLTVEDLLHKVPKEFVVPLEIQSVGSELPESQSHVKEIDEIERLSPFKENLSTSSANLGSQSSLPELQSSLAEGQQFSDDNLLMEIDVRSAMPEFEHQLMSSDTKSPVPEETHPLIGDSLLVQEPERSIYSEVDKIENIVEAPIVEIPEPFKLAVCPSAPEEVTETLEGSILDEIESTTELPVEFTSNVIVDPIKPPEPPVNLSFSCTKPPSPKIQSPLSPSKSPLPQSISPSGYPVTHEIDSPVEDITSSVKDSPLPFASPTEQVNTCIAEFSEPVYQSEVFSEVTSPKSVIDTESVATTDVNSFLERSLVPEIASPLSGDESHIIGVCNTGLELIQNVEIKSELIQPEFPEQMVTTPLEESKSEEILCLQPDVATEVVAVKAVDEKLEKAKTTTLSDKKVPSKTTVKPTLKTTRLTTTKSSTTTKPTQSKPPVSTANKLPLVSKVPPKDKSKIMEKKPLANGDVKTLIKKTATPPAPKPPAQTKASTPKSPISATSKATPTPSTRPELKKKLSAPKVGSKVSPVPTKPSVTKTSTTVTKTTTTTANLVSKVKTTIPPAKPKPLASKLTPKAPDTEKQIKETNNKQLTASGTANRLSSPHKPLTTVRKPKPSSSTVPKPSLDIKKPQELVRHVTNKPKTTAVKKTMSSKTVANGDPTKELIKDVSPVIENIVDNSQILDVNNTD